MKVVQRIRRESEAQWLEARKGFVTATEVAQLARRGEAYWRELREIKSGVREAKDLSHIPEIQHGREREPLIVPYVQSLEPGMVHNEDLVVRLGRYAATPDLLGDGLVGEIKTVKDTRLEKLQAAGDWPTGQYFDQVQWQLFVTGAIACVFVWEPYEDWDGVLVPREDKRGNITIHRDEERIKQLRAVADRFLGGETTPVAMGVPDEVQRLLGELQEIRWEKQRVVVPIVREERRILDELKALAGGEPVSWECETFRVTVTEPKQCKRLDRKKLFAENPQLAEEDYLAVSEQSPRIRIVENKKENNNG